MRSLSTAIVVVLLLLTLPGGSSSAQEAAKPDLGPAQAAAESLAKVPEPPAPVNIPNDLEGVVKKQFGPSFSIAKTSSKILMTHIQQENETPWTPFMTGDLDGDGVEDAIIIARSKDALGGEAMYDYKVLDPMNQYFGWGNPKVTSTFAAEDPIHNTLVLVIHGAGKEGWRAEKPKAKFVWINLRFDRLTLSGATLKKKAIAAVRVEESDGVASLVFWDGKKYKYLPGAAGGG
jgi:hypothetical protein